MGNSSYIVNTSSRKFSLPIQRTTEREIFDYIDIERLFNTENQLENFFREETDIDGNTEATETMTEGTEVREEEIPNEETTEEVGTENPETNIPDSNDPQEDLNTTEEEDPTLETEEAPLEEVPLEENTTDPLENPTA